MMADKFPSFIRKYVDDIGGGFSADETEYYRELKETFDKINLKQHISWALVDDDKDDEDYDPKDERSFSQAMFNCFDEYIQQKAMELKPLPIGEQRKELKDFIKSVEKLSTSISRLSPSAKFNLYNSGFDLEVSRKIIEYGIFFMISDKQFEDFTNRYEPQYDDPLSGISAIFPVLIEKCEIARENLKKQGCPPTRHAEKRLVNDLSNTFREYLARAKHISVEEGYYEKYIFKFVRKAFDMFGIELTNGMIKKHLKKLK